MVLSLSSSRGERSGSAGDVAGNSAAFIATERNLGTGKRRDLLWTAFDRARARWTTQWRATTIARDQVESLRRIVRCRTWLSHRHS